MEGEGTSGWTRQSAALEIGGFDETLPSLPDTDFYWRMQLAGYELHFAPDAIVHYRLRSRISGVIRQARQYAVADVALHRKYEAQGMPPIRFSSALRGWAELGLRAPLLLTRAGRFRYAWILGFRLGRIQGMMRYRFPAL
ncbi:MAG: hypothetical protein KatS3mg011_0844 [Acidimicrobiia bacterium]|nr:MAG: hypothetical protein KatS3mg011_0844 [Acidimicrobiia bacterium]